MADKYSNFDWEKLKDQNHLSNKIVMKAKELGINPKKFINKSNQQNIFWKKHLKEMINYLYDRKAV